MPTRIVGKNADMGLSAGNITIDGPFAFSSVVMLGKRMTTFSLNIDLNTQESTAYQTEAGAVADWKEFEVIDGNWTVDFECWFNTATAPDVSASLLDPALLFGKRGWIGYPNGYATPNTTTKPRYSGRALLTAAPVSLPSRALASIRGSLQGDATLFRSVSGADV